MDKENSDGYLDYLGLKKFYNALKKKLIKTDDTLTKSDDDIIGVSLPVKALTTSEYEILSEEEKMAEVQYIITDDNGPNEQNNIISNPNLLDNWYFVGGGSQQGDGQFPINQRGDTEYKEQGYTIDRWVMSNKINFKLEDSYITLTVSANSTAPFFAQHLRIGSPIKGKTLTLSILMGNNVLKQVTVTVPEVLDGNWSTYQVSLGNKWFMDIYYQNSTKLFSVRLFVNSTTTEESVNVAAAKLELGDVQTLAHKEGDTWVLNDPAPNFQQELAKCQRYQMELCSRVRSADVIGIGTAHSANGAIIIVPVPTTMRATTGAITYTGNWYLVNNTITWKNGITITDIKINRIEPNSVILLVTANGITPGNTYYLANETTGSNPPSLMIDCNL